MPDRVAIVLTVWLAAFTAAGSALGRYVLDIPGTLTVAGFMLAIVTTFLWPWILPRWLDRWMDGGFGEDHYESWIDQGRTRLTDARGWVRRSRTALTDVRRLARHDRHMDDGAAV